MSANSVKKKKPEQDVSETEEIIEPTVIEEVLPTEEDKLKQEKDKYLRLLAEFDNYKKRTAKEKQALSDMVVCECINKILPVYDNLLRATQSDGDTDSLKKGVEMVIKQFSDFMDAMSIEEIATEHFNPDYHNAVMHIEDESLGENEIIDVLQKGYKRGDNVIRHSMVKVAN